MKHHSQKIITAESNQLAQMGAELFNKIAKQAISTQGRFAVAVSGGSTPRVMHRLLSQEPYLSGIDWQNTHLFWVDERMVPFDHPDSNFGAAQRDFLFKIPIPLNQIYPMQVMVRPEEGASLYQANLKHFFQRLGNTDPIFDLVFLGVGKDGHTASLFPDQALTLSSQSWVIAVKGGDPDRYRLTMTYSVLNKARHVCFMVSGKKKALIIKTLLEGRAAELPAGKIKPANGTLTWLLDQKAASLLSDEKNRE